MRPPSTIATETAGAEPGVPDVLCLTIASSFSVTGGATASGDSVAAHAAGGAIASDANAVRANSDRATRFIVTGSPASVRHGDTRARPRAARALTEGLLPP